MPGQVVEGQFKLTDYVPNQTIMMQCDWVGPLKPGGGYVLEAAPEGTRIHMVERASNCVAQSDCLRHCWRLCFGAPATPSYATSNAWSSSNTSGNHRRLAIILLVDPLG